MKLLKLHARHYRSLLDQTIELNDFNLFIGSNAAGKSTILDALRFLSEAVQARDFREPVFTRGGFIHLAWKGAGPQQKIELKVHLENAGRRFEWEIHLVRRRFGFHTEECVTEMHQDSPPERLLEAEIGSGWWWSGEQGKVALKQGPTSCALTAAAADASFPARDVAEFISRWGFFDPHPFLLRRDWTGLDSARFDHYGRNLSGTLHALNTASPETFNRVVETTRSILGLPVNIEPRESEDRFYFIQKEPGLEWPVHQMGASSGTLRVLALMTALQSEPETNLIGIEEPENYIHPTALSALLDHLQSENHRVQFLVTTHSPLLLDFLNKPEAVRVVRRAAQRGTTVLRQENPESVRRALNESGFGLGEFYETKGFGSD